MSSESGSLPRQARAVVVGSGIVGSSVAYHLTRLGWSDVLLIDKGPLPNPGGSTGHASNFIFPVDHSKEMTALTLDSIRQYEELETFVASGGIEVARTEERMQELWRRMSSAASWGVDPVSMITPAEIEALVPYVDATVLLGGFYTPSVGIVDPIRAGELMRTRAIESGRLSVVAEVEVVGIDVERGRVRRVRTTEGDVEAETVVIACGVWSPRLARMAGAAIPLTPAVHQMIDVARCRGSRTRKARSRSRSSATWTPACTSGSGSTGSRSARTRTGRSSTIPRTCSRSERRIPRRPSFRSRRRTSRSSSRTRGSSCPSCATTPCRP